MMSKGKKRLIESNLGSQVFICQGYVSLIGGSVRNLGQLTTYGQSPVNGEIAHSWGVVHFYHMFSKGGELRNPLLSLDDTLICT